MVAEVGFELLGGSVEHFRDGDGAAVAGGVGALEGARQELGDGLGLGESLFGQLLRLGGPDGLPGAETDAQDQRGEDHRRGAEPDLIPPPCLFHPVGGARRPGQHHLVVEMPPEVVREAVGGFVTAGPVLLQRLHHDPVEVAANGTIQLGGLRTALGRHGGQLLLG